MGISTLVTTKRAGTVVAQHIPVRLDNISAVVASQMGGASPYNTYELYSQVGVPDIRTGDQLMDENAIDPKTNSNVLYRVMGNPETWDGSYLSTLVERVVGKVPL